MAGRPWITCHVLDTVAGKPGANIHVTLTSITASQHPTLQDSAHTWTARTNADGRVEEWTPDPLGRQPLNSFIENFISLKESKMVDLGGNQAVWSLTFQTEEYYGKGKTFWPEVELRFATDLDEKHYHVPLLLGPWSYTTYRGS